MPLVDMPDGATVELPDNPSPELKAQIKAKVDQILADQAVKGETGGEAPPKPPGSAAGMLVGTTAANQAFEETGTSRPDEGLEEINKGVQEMQSGWTPTIARTAGPLVGAAVGSAIPIVGTAAGAAVGAGVGDWIAQSSEMETGLRQAYNPLRTGAEVITAGYFSKFQAGKTLMKAAASGALGNMASDTFINLTEGKGLPSNFDLAVSGLTGGILSGAGMKGEDLWRARKAAALEISGSHEVAEGMADFMGPTRGGQQLELPGSRLDPNRSIVEPPAQQLGFPDVQKLSPETGLTTRRTQPFAGETTPEVTLTPAEKGQRTRFMKKQAATKQRWSDEQLTHQFGFDDVEEGRTFEKIMGTEDLPDNYSLNLGEATTTDKSWKVHQISADEQSEWARMKALARGKKEMLDTPLDRDPTFGDITPDSRYNPERGLANKAKGELTRKQKNRLKRTEGTLAAGRPKDTFKRLEVDYDYPVYQDYHDTSQVYRKAQQDVTRDSKVANQALDKTSKADRIAIFQSFLAGGDFSNLPQKIRGKAAALWDMADKQLAEYSLSAQEYFGDYLHQIGQGKSMKQIIEEGSAPAAIPKRLQFAEDMADTLFSPTDPSIVRVMNKLIETGSYRRHVAEKATEVASRYGADSAAPQAIKDEMQYYLRSLKGSTGDPRIDKTNKIFDLITGTLGLDMSGKELADYLVRGTHLGLMSARPAAVIKNAMQTIQTGIPLYGVKSFAAGVKRAATEEGMEVARKAGILSEGNQLSEFGLRAGKLQKAADVGLKPFGYIEDKNRAISYLAGLDKFDRALEKASKSTGRANWRTLMDKADIDKLSEPEIAVLAKMWDAGESMDKIRHTYAQGIVDDTQFMYMMPEKAKILQTQAGRVGLGYANYGQGYASYMARMMGQGPVNKRIRQGTMWLGTNAVLATAFMKMGGIFGDEDGFKDALGWTFTGPLMYNGGPIVTTAQGLADTVRKASQGGVNTPEKAWTFGKSVARDISTFVPLGGAVQDVIKAYNEPTKKEMMGRFLGFKRGKK